MTAAGAWVLRLLILVVSHAGGTVDLKCSICFLQSVRCLDLIRDHESSGRQLLSTAYR
jgi:hypothetical protein